MSNSHARLVRALVFACLFPLFTIAFAGSAKTTVAGDGLALTAGNSSAPIAVR